MGETQRWQFWMDTGGTFTDCLACAPDGRRHRLKVLSSGALRVGLKARRRADQVCFDRAWIVGDSRLEGFSVRPVAGGEAAMITGWDSTRRLATLDRAVTWRVGDVVDVGTGEEAPVLAMRLLTGTAAGDPLPLSELRLATTRGTNALLEGKGARVVLFVTAGFGDLLRIRDQRRPDLFALRVQKPPPLHGPVLEVHERLTADGREETALDLGRLRADAARLRSDGYDVAAVALLHSYRDDRHEKAVAAVLREVGFRHVSLSSELAPFIKIVPRAETAVVDATLGPVMEQYLSGVASVLDADRLLVMTSAGGLVRRASFRPKDGLLSGPAGGVAGAAAVARRAGLARIIAFDMGGTSTDVARYEGDFDYQHEHVVGHARVMAPALRVESVAAGGGSVCRFDPVAGSLIVGPESAGARPGPACYGAGGPLTLTDVNLLLGRLDPGRFALPVFPDAAEAALRAVLDEVGAGGGAGGGRGGGLHGFLEIADARMADAIRRISVREGYDASEYVLVAFGGAGGLHACAVAARLGMRRVLHPADSGLLSAYGLGRAAEECIRERQILEPLPKVAQAVSILLRELEEDGRRTLGAGDVPEDEIQARRAELELRFAGQDQGLVIPAEPAASVCDRFLAAYRKRFGYAPTDRVIEVVTARVVVRREIGELERETFAEGDGASADADARAHPPRIARADCVPGMSRQGPCLVQDGFSTLHVAPGWTARMGSLGSILLESVGVDAPAGGGRGEVVEAELFTSRFRSLVAEMGLLLQRCALSVNIKERLDFSCALLDAAGCLVVNAPHVPVHLGALGLCVRSVVQSMPLGPGDVAITNHPAHGGAHLPDVTLIAPVHAEDGTLLAYVANRAHHAEIGGVRPGSMPPDAHSLAEEGVVLPPIRFVRDGEADWGVIEQRLRAGLHPSRRVDENLADLHAQLASIRLGVAMLEELARRHGASLLRHYMDWLQDRAASALSGVLDRIGLREAGAVDQLDDGARIAVEMTRRDGRLLIDFSGSAGVHPGNLNATPAIVRSAVIYVLRVLAGCDLPLNEGLLRQVDLVLPAGMLAPPFEEDPTRCPAVVGGNVETSQRIVDVLVRALGLAASSQGTMNNLIFGNTRCSYYETIGGGTGAGDGFRGCDGVHSHMTNTAITDPEILELRLPVRLERFALRCGSGGAGRFVGGEGLERVIRFLEPVDISLLTQRRTDGPPGLCGGGAGAPGEQWIERAQGGREPLVSIAGTSAAGGDRLIIRTPGGGGWGRL